MAVLISHSFSTLMKENNHQYILYARKSTESDERQTQSIEDQVRLMRKMADDLGLTIYKEIIESKSAKEPNTRPGFAEMIADIKKGRASGILTWKLDRLTRNPIDSGLLEWLLQHGTIHEIRTFDRPFLPEDNAIIMSVEASMANQYIRDLRRNVMRGMKSKLEKGWFPGLAPKGYLNVRSAMTGISTIEKDPERFPLIKKAWQLLLTGTHTVPELLTLLNDQWGYRTKRTRKRGGLPISRSSLYSIFSNPFYAGMIDSGGKLYPGKHTPMITPDEFDKAQEIIGRRRRFATENKKREYSYTGLIKCHECDGTVSATLIRKKLKSGEIRRHTFYYCIRARREKTCSQQSYVRAVDIDDQIEELLASFSLRKKHLAWGLEILKRQSSSKQDQKQIENESRQNAIETLKKQQTNLTSLRVRDLITDEGFDDERKRIDDELIRLEIETSSDLNPSVDNQAKEALTFCDALQDRFKNGGLKVRREVATRICSNRTLKDKKLKYSLADWVKAVAEFSKTDIRSLEVFEPAKYPSTKHPNGDCERQFRVMWTRLDEVRTCLSQQDSPQSHRISNLKHP